MLVKCSHYNLKSGTQNRLCWTWEWVAEVDTNSYVTIEFREACILYDNLILGICFRSPPCVEDCCMFFSKNFENLVYFPVAGEYLMVTQEQQYNTTPLTYPNQFIHSLFMFSLFLLQEDMNHGLEMSAVWYAVKIWWKFWLVVSRSDTHFTTVSTAAIATVTSVLPPPHGKANANGWGKDHWLFGNSITVKYLVMKIDLMRAQFFLLSLATNRLTRAELWDLDNSFEWLLHDNCCSPILWPIDHH